MTELVLLELAAERADINWEIFQFWSGVTFAYMAVGHFAAKSINWFVVVVLSILYVSLSVVVYHMSDNNLAVMEGLTLELGILAKSNEVTAASQAWLAESKPTAPFLIALSIATLGTFLSALLYLPYNHYRAIRNAT
ncbi:hypothetical protein EYC98_19890 [Halieaceae bacterium IMCC14734]|uniref:DUF1772 domain-containing protein n=1 Tax=Candidatus Litorirhabdus singularis TaxID=2518993 RepID=A0ABT3TLH8_9GAMM|nr:hypothetical protein [Candidatus Litorirhabdus singularis]MCX2983130.1 hypothetical protein [Candidatus Litorirhabdus singularis]